MQEKFPLHHRIVTSIIFFLFLTAGSAIYLVLSHPWAKQARITLKGAPS